MNNGKTIPIFFRACAQFDMSYFRQEPLSTTVEMLQEVVGKNDSMGVLNDRDMSTSDSASDFIDVST